MGNDDGEEDDDDSAGQCIQAQHNPNHINLSHWICRRLCKAQSRFLGRQLFLLFLLLLLLPIRKLSNWPVDIVRRESAHRGDDFLLPPSGDLSKWSLCDLSIRSN